MKRVTLTVVAFSLALTATAVSARRDRDDYRGRNRAAATFYVKDDYRGRAISVDRPVRDMRQFGINDKISSVRVRGGVWLACTDYDFGGKCRVIDRSIKHLGKIGIEDKISSVRPLRGDERAGNWERY